MLYMHNMHMWQVYEAWDSALSSHTSKVNKTKLKGPSLRGYKFGSLSLSSFWYKQELSLSPAKGQALSLSTCAPKGAKVSPSGLGHLISPFNEPWTLALQLFQPHSKLLLTLHKVAKGCPPIG